MVRHYDDALENAFVMLVCTGFHRPAFGKCVWDVGAQLFSS